MSNRLMDMTLILMMRHAKCSVKKPATVARVRASALLFFRIVNSVRICAE
jgi:hypothetical protein